MTFGQRLLVWRMAVQVMLWRHGWGWPLAAVLGGLAAVLYLGMIVPDRVELTNALELLESEATASRRAAVVPLESTEQQRLDALQALLRSSPPVGDLVRTMVTVAQTERISLQQGDYQQQLHPATHAIQLQITHPVGSTYPQLRSYIETVLRSIPNASLDQIAVRRENVGQAQLQARLRWSIWTQAPVAPPLGPARANGRETSQ